jgi:hypothetical protein
VTSDFPLPIRLGLPSIAWYLRPAIGSCQEYTNASSAIIPPPFCHLVGHLLQLPKKASKLSDATPLIQKGRTHVALL